VAGFEHEGADKIVGNEVDGEFFFNHGGGFAAEDFHSHRGFKVAEIKFGLPAAAVEVGEIGGGEGVGVEQGGDDHDGSGAEPGVATVTVIWRTVMISGISRHDFSSSHWGQRPDFFPRTRASFFPMFLTRPALMRRRCPTGPGRGCARGRSGVRGEFEEGAGGEGEDGHDPHHRETTANGGPTPAPPSGPGPAPARMGLVLQGTITPRSIPRPDPDAPDRIKIDGPYYQWTFKQAGKTVTVNLTAAQARVYQKSH